jgi:hypothetical protein
LGSSDGSFARSEEGLNKCPAMEAISVTAAVMTKEAITYEDLATYLLVDKIKASSMLEIVG